jgi:hypothetical protein
MISKVSFATIEPTLIVNVLPRIVTLPPILKSLVMKTLPEIIESFPVILENTCVRRFQVYLDTGFYPVGEYNQMWDCLAWVAAQKNKFFFTLRSLAIMAAAF